jgi:multidrug efflux pump subunit AcrA (membrane-fusion protein)
MGDFVKISEQIEEERVGPQIGSSAGPAVRAGRLRRFLWGAAAAAWLLLWGCSGEKAPAPPEAPRVSGVPVLAVRETSVPETVEFPGTVKAAVASVLSSKVLGRITAVHVREGDPVHKGQVLVEVDARQVTAGLRQAEAGLEQARFAVREAEEAVRVAKADLQATQADRELARVTFERFKNLFARESVSAQEYDQVAARYKAASAQVEKARRAVQAAQARKAQALALEQAAQAALEDARSLLDYVRIASPVDGVVTAKHVEVSQMAAPGVPLVTVEDTSRYRLEVAVPESSLGFIRLGDPVPVFFPEAAEPITGRVSEIVPALDPASRTALMKIELGGREKGKGERGKVKGERLKVKGEKEREGGEGVEKGEKSDGSRGPDGSAQAQITGTQPEGRQAEESALSPLPFALSPSTLLRSGAFARARFRVGERTAVLVPREAVYERGQLTGVFVVEADGTVRARLVRLGKSLDGKVEVLSGLKPGERIASRIVPGLVDGAQLVRN